MMAESVTEEPNRTLSNRWIEQDTSPLTEEVAVIWSNSTPFPGNETNGTNATLPFVFAPIVWSASKAGSFLASLLIMIGTVFGNALVLLSVYFEKKLQTPFNFYLVNLAIPFFFISFWIWSDYTMTFESVVTLAAIRWVDFFFRLIGFFTDF